MIGEVACLRSMMCGKNKLMVKQVLGSHDRDFKEGLEMQKLHGRVQRSPGKLQPYTNENRSATLNQNDSIRVKC